MFVCSSNNIYFKTSKRMIFKVQYIANIVKPVQKYSFQHYHDNIREKKYTHSALRS